MQKVTVNINQEFIPSDEETEKKFRDRVAELLQEIDIACEFDDIGTTYSWKDTGDEDLTDDDGEWVQGILERAWNEACF